MPLLHKSPQIPIAGSKDPNINGYHFVITDPDYLTFLDHPEADAPACWVGSH